MQASHSTSVSETQKLGASVSTHPEGGQVTHNQEDNPETAALAEAGEGKPAAA